MAQAAYQKKLDDLQKAFQNADTDKKGLLTEFSFKEFVQIGFKKECPDGMYGYLCSHYQVDLAQGLTWQTAPAICKESNPPPKETTKSPNGGKSTTAAVPKNSMKGESIGKHSKSPQPGANGNVSFSSMTRSKTDETARSRSQSPDGTVQGGDSRDKSLSNSISGTTRSSYRSGVINGSSVSDGTSSNIDRSSSNGNNNTSSMVVQTMEAKLINCGNLTQEEKASGIELFPQNLDKLLRNIGKDSRNDIIKIDGSTLEGGGQILRNGMAFAALLRQPIHIVNIRGKRPTPGLASQHLHGLLLAQQIYGGYLSGVYLRSMEILYIPQNGTSNKRDFFVDTKTTGSICLLLQSSLPLLFSMPDKCSVLLRGGTNASPFAPHIDYFKLLVQPMFEKLFGLKMKIVVNERGFNPRGGGEVQVITKPVTSRILMVEPINSIKSAIKNEEKEKGKGKRVLPGIDMCKRGNLVSISGIVVIGGDDLEMSIGDEIRNGILAQLSTNAEFKRLIDENGNNCDGRNDNDVINIQVSRERSHSCGASCVVVAQTDEGCMIGGSGLRTPNSHGRKKRKKVMNIDYKQVGMNAGKELLTDWEYGNNVCTDRHFQDQLIVFMALAQGKSKFKSCSLQLHTETAIHFAQILTGAKFNVKRENDGILIECQGIGLTM